SAPTPGWIPRTLGLAAVALALLSAFLTFVVLAGLTPIAPTHEVVVTLLLANAVTVFLLILVIARGVGSRAGEAARARGGATARAHRRLVLHRRCGPRDCGRRGGQRDARPGPRSPVLAADAVADREFADRGRRLCARTRPVRARRQHRHCHRTRTRQALVRPVTRAVPSVPRGSSLDPRIAGGHAARQGPQRRRSGRRTEQRGLRQAIGGSAGRHQRHRAASGDVSR